MQHRETNEQLLYILLTTKAGVSLCPVQCCGRVRRRFAVFESSQHSVRLLAKAVLEKKINAENWGNDIDRGKWK